jgi:hypothetical protein
MAEVAALITGYGRRLRGDAPQKPSHPRSGPRSGARWWRGRCEGVYQVQNTLFGCSIVFAIWL